MLDLHLVHWPHWPDFLLQEHLMHWPQLPGFLLQDPLNLRLNWEPLNSHLKAQHFPKTAQSL